MCILGDIIDEDAFLEEIVADEIGGAALDVLTEESSSSDHPLVNCDSVILTPYAAWNSKERIIELRQKAAWNVRD